MHLIVAIITSAAEQGSGLPSQIEDNHDQIILALITIVGTSIAALVYTIKNNALGKGIARDAYEANKAVNNIGPGEHRLYDVIARIEKKQDEFDKKWGNLPEDMDDAVGLVELIHGMDKRITDVHKDLLDHVEWEMGTKWSQEQSGP